MMKKVRGLVEESYAKHLLYVDDDPDPTIEVPDAYPEM